MPIAGIAFLASCYSKVSKGYKHMSQEHKNIFLQRNTTDTRVVSSFFFLACYVVATTYNYAVLRFLEGRESVTRVRFARHAFLAPVAAVFRGVIAVAGEETQKSSMKPLQSSIIQSTNTHKLH